MITDPHTGRPISVDGHPDRHEHYHSRKGEEPIELSSKLGAGLTVIVPRRPLPDGVDAKGSVIPFLIQAIARGDVRGIETRRHDVPTTDSTAALRDMISQLQNMHNSLGSTAERSDRTFIRIGVWKVTIPQGAVSLEDDAVKPFKQFLARHAEDVKQNRMLDNTGREEGKLTSLNLIDLEVDDNSADIIDQVVKSLSANVPSAAIVEVFDGRTFDDVHLRDALFEFFTEEEFAELDKNVRYQKLLHEYGGDADFVETIYSKAKKRLERGGLSSVKFDELFDDIEPDFVHLLDPVVRTAALNTDTEPLRLPFGP